ncbi:MAG: hypothetical protein WDO19_31015 [Bacteroidota bacterium]
MKRIFTLCIVLCTVLTGFAQTDTTGKQSDTIKVGTMIIIRKPGNNTGESKRDKHIIISNNNRHYKPSNISTNWIILDLGLLIIMIKRIMLTLLLLVLSAPG